MDLTQSKLTKAEWVTMEIPVSEQEKQVLQLLLDGYHDILVRRNETPTLASVSKIETTPVMQQHLYQQYLEPIIRELSAAYFDQHGMNKKTTMDGQLLSKTVSLCQPSGGVGLKSLLHRTNSWDSAATKKTTMAIKKCDLIRMKSMDGKIDEHRQNIYEFVLLDFCRKLIASKATTTTEKTKYTFYVYTLDYLMQHAHIPGVHPSVPEFVQRVLASSPVNPRDMLRHAHQSIEKNPYLFKYADKTLFDHQKQLFRLFSTSTTTMTPKLVFYTAPTGTGKTLSPLGLSEGYRVIFICAARHVGLALAKSAVSMQKRVAVAFGCDTASDIRLHYFAASEYTKNKRSGGIGKVDNMVGDKVEIMICDVKSYLVAMHYMLAFSPEYDEDDDDDSHNLARAKQVPVLQKSKRRDADLITYWDEPTITMDYVDHPLHATIRRNWQENLISKVVLSCATLPKERELGDVIGDFYARFPGATHHTIHSYESSKSITLWNKSGGVVLPHRLFRDPKDMVACVQHCLDHRELLRYMDLSEIVRFIEYVHDHHVDDFNAALRVDQYFGSTASAISSMNMQSLKEYYLVLLQRIPEDKWSAMYDALLNAKRVSDGSGGGGCGTSLTTRDAHTLTDGPTIFLAEDVEKVGRFLIQQSNIPIPVFQQVSEKIAQNSHLQRQMDELQHQIEDREALETNREQNQASSAKSTKSSSRDRESSDMTRLTDQMEQMRAQIRNVCLDNAYIPNTVPHQRLWVPRGVNAVSNAFVPSVDATAVREIMALDVTDSMKLLLLMGIGMFVNDFHPKYVEIMKRLASEQRLFLILASSDYIYGTNYQFCHGFVGKDLQDMTYQKTIQAMGRIGRNHIQQEYTVRFRDDAMVAQLFLPADCVSREAETMNRLFTPSWGSGAN